jgi:hypothetical protein
MFVGNVQNGQGKADLRGGAAGFPCAEEGGLKGDPQDIDSLILDDLDGKDAVKTSGKYGKPPGHQY